MLAVLIAVVVYVQTQRLADQASAQNEALLGRSANQENIRFVRETVISGSLEMPFEKLDLSYATFRGLHFGCTDRERLRASHWKDAFASPNYTGGRCRADFSSSNLDHADLGGAQLHAASFGYSTLFGATLASANIGQATFRYANLNRARLDRAAANRAWFQATSLDDAVFRDADLTYAKFIDIDFVGTDFRGARLFGAEFVDVSCDRVSWPRDFTPPEGCD